MNDTQKRFKLLPEMEGPQARWYARLRGTEPQLEANRVQAAQLTADLPDGTDILEIAPGPGYHAVELAKLGRFTVTGLDISRTMVDIATEYAKRSGVTVDFRRGDATNLPFEAGSFDLIVCQAAFKNFVEPVRAINEIHRVLRNGGTAVIQDMSGEATNSAIDHEVLTMNVNRVNAFMTKVALLGLRRRAFSPARFKDLAAQSTFGACTVSAEGIGLEVRLRKA
ncbi:MAG: class SAM-dependent methyltransferase [Amycolatopsis sp.]|uniref:class I SAM-dependent methyltransferase n=1 Tax=Amycolatopsis sp. TaxID=37632 RepID=UPI0026213A6E|nr:class I SAM-dependent methyltransferase [Amycolatopsis sp.]MCU1684400.1 class SAM-dependent methyltransferase [Amycolatopsis sp.]